MVEVMHTLALIILISCFGMLILGSLHRIEEKLREESDDLDE